jgi:hypothetical protein
MPVTLATGLSDGGDARSHHSICHPLGPCWCCANRSDQCCLIANRMRTESWACAWREPAIIFQRDARREAVEAWERQGWSEAWEKRPRESPGIHVPQRRQAILRRVSAKAHDVTGSCWASYSTRYGPPSILRWWHVHSRFEAVFRSPILLGGNLRYLRTEDVCKNSRFNEVMWMFIATRMASSVYFAWLDFNLFTKSEWLIVEHWLTGLGSSCSSQIRYMNALGLVSIHPLPDLSLWSHALYRAQTQIDSFLIVVCWWRIFFRPVFDVDWMRIISKHWARC